MTAKEFLKILPKDSNWELSSIVENAMIEFAKYHVEQTLLKVANSDMDDICSWSGNPYTSEGSDNIDFDKVMKIYPLENIK